MTDFYGKTYRYNEQSEEVLNSVLAECEDVGKSESKPVMKEDI